MKVLHLVNELVATGNGIVNVTVDLAIDQVSRGDTVAVASAGGGFVALLAENGVRHVTIDFRGRPLHATRALSRLIREYRPDVVHAHTVAPCVLAAVVRRVPGAPDYAVVATMHNVYQRFADLMSTADITVGVAESVAETVRARRWHSPLVGTVVNGVIDSPRRSGSRALDDHRSPPELGPRSIVTVGAVSRRKGADILLDAFTTLALTRPDVHLWFVGNPDWDVIVHRARESDLSDRIHLVGLSDDPRSYLESATVVAIPSRREGLALSLIEAREAGAAIVAADTDGAREGLDDGTAGVLVPVGDPDALATALADVLDDPGHRDDLRRQASSGLERFSVARMGRDYRDRYAEASSLRSRGRATS